ncbi:MAG: uracil-DNA glycosylase [Pirellulales bacterium]|nr:uracil-DNA glycosylase [Pirellulales bacterium]
MVQKGPQSEGRIARTVLQKLESLHRAGVSHMGKVPLRAETPPADMAAVAQSPDDDRAAALAAGTHAPGDDQAAALAAVQREVAACVRCAELARTRKQTVFGAGNPLARLVFLGEAPGADEDRQGEPFVGRAGKLLTDMIEKGMKLKRRDVYIMNILRCRPPGNRNPLPVEAAACRQFLDRQLAVIQPEFICCLGAVAAQNLLQTTTSIGRLRGHFHDYQGIKVLCTYHPAYLLRNPSAKRPTWDDLRLLMEEMGLRVP